MANIERSSFKVFKRDWTLHEGASEDEIRHNEKVKEAIRNNLPDIVSDGSIITADPNSKKVVRVPMKSLELPKFRFGDNNEQEGFGSGEGDEGDIFGKRPVKGNGNGEKGDAGVERGMEYYEAEITLDELREMVYQDLGLPYLEAKAAKKIIKEKIVFDERVHKPRMSNIDLLKTILENMKRNALESGEVSVGDFSEDDIWVRDWSIKKEQISSAVIIAMADISGSMGDFERYITRAFCWWMNDALRTLYPQVEVCFIVHDTDAEEVAEQAFFTRGSSGGTMCSSANELAKKIIANRYPPTNYNVYLVHFSDGDNFGFDNDKCVSLVNEMLLMGVSQYGYVQIGNTRWGELLKLYNREIDHERFHSLIIEDKQDVLPALKEIFDAERV